MNPAICEREKQTFSAICGGTISQEIFSHAQRCPACSEILMVGELLHASGTLTDHERVALPDPGLIWRKAQWKATQKAVHTALRPIRFMKIIACVAFGCSPWLRWLLPIKQELSASWSRAIDLNLSFVSKAWPATGSEVMLLVGFSGTIVLLALSSWYMLREE